MKFVIYINEYLNKEKEEIKKKSDKLSPIFNIKNKL